jgi:hypothetical protein
MGNIDNGTFKSIDTRPMGYKINIPGVSDLWNLLKKKFGATDFDEEFYKFDASKKSSNVGYVTYSPRLKILQVQFWWGEVYRYPDVSEKMFLDFKNAPSYGKWIWNNFRTPTDDVVDYERLGR